jgi:predicted nucleic acid-binding protein
MIIVSDTSTITNLLQINRLDILKSLYGTIVIPPGVRRELYRIEGQKTAIEKLDWIKTQYPHDQQLIAELLEDLDLGESEAIALAVELDAEYLIIDEYKGRAIAEMRGIKIVGLLGILIAAKTGGHIESVRPLIEKIRSNGFRLNSTLVDKVLTALGEK